MELKRTVAPADAIIQAPELWEHLRAETGTDNEPEDWSYIDALRDSVTDHLDGYAGILGRALITQTWEMYLDDWPATGCEIEIPLPPLQSVTGITYVDTDGATQTLASSVYQIVDRGNSPSAIVLAYNQSWPSIRSQRQAITVTFRAGYGDTPDTIPGAIRHAVKLLAGHLYENREDTLVGTSIAELPFAARHLLAPHRVRYV